MKPLYDVLASTVALFDDLLAVEDQKVGAITQNDVAMLDECMKKEEALSLRFRGLDRKREEAQRDFGFENLTLLEIAQKVGPPEAERFTQFHEDLSEKVQELNRALDCAKKLIEVNTKSIEHLLAAREAAAAGYDKTGEAAEKTDRPRLTVDEI